MGLVNIMIKIACNTSWKKLKQDKIEVTVSNASSGRICDVR